MGINQSVAYERPGSAHPLRSNYGIVMQQKELELLNNTNQAGKGSGLINASGLKDSIRVRKKELELLNNTNQAGKGSGLINASGLKDSIRVRKKELELLNNTNQAGKGTGPINALGLNDSIGVRKGKSNLFKNIGQEGKGTGPINALGLNDSIRVHHKRNGNKKNTEPLFRGADPTERSNKTKSSSTSFVTPNNSAPSSSSSVNSASKRPLPIHGSSKPGYKPNPVVDNSIKKRKFSISFNIFNHNSKKSKNSKSGNAGSLSATNSDKLQKMPVNMHSPTSRPDGNSKMKKRPGNNRDLLQGGGVSANSYAKPNGPFYSNANEPRSVGNNIPFNNSGDSLTSARKNQQVNGRSIQIPAPDYPKAPSGRDLAYISRSSSPSMDYNPYKAPGFEYAKTMYSAEMRSRGVGR